MKKILLVIFTAFFFLKSISQQKYACVSSNISGKEKKGILNESGKLILPIIYEYIVVDNAYYFVCNDSLWGCVNKEGEVKIPIKYENISCVISEEKVRVKKHSKWGFVNINDSLIIDFNYDFACNFYNGKSYVKNNDTKFYIDSHGNKLYDAEENIQYCSEDVDTAASIKDQFEDNILTVKKKNGKFGVINKETNQVIVPFEYDEIGLYHNNVILMRLGNKWGAYTDKGKLITTTKFIKQ